ncbi:acyl-CoA carboxylase subunit epsilon [Rhodococcus sp. BP-349]|uniref:acyl-CoA carboxylase subunit epsilon n=1 Tax=unclassified Rhodococcus (in: high G+C Gram-positive bacteria) TaxID=192944 RepID=UPI001C9B48BD|nr:MULTISPECIES: acyl-CoA carboxylase subunit epsilon [unclassified Rhodococcus (in: high G+C Gram-positive bacteria)]MBY6538885.1 acyl-CoA carboxylase subunit epsilon [Rhodococcus sp. BP-363]MBY6543222.1 acyl-CoA carboxylase subunit epsilon [Rhodococcus sp. BP-369]MBY6562452.1 acyl-CoA carboxylase subunit epsilon [Rhodococcus sp. BP-370]MBY6576744.1 acyl-CoA carboxylase subunit epsilon [Rhodococcus sp. BP-364]MBY6586045.1 acyl-CoA carboxylase subunit epsilon [Rhodococcus sp. BP-358]
MTSADDRTESGADETAPSAPFLRVESGHPTDEEIAALVAVLSAADAGPAEIPVLDHWGRPSTMHRPGTAFSPYSFTTGVTGPR